MMRVGSCLMGEKNGASFEFFGSLTFKEVFLDELERIFLRGDWMG